MLSLSLSLSSRFPLLCSQTETHKSKEQILQKAQKINKNFVSMAVEAQHLNLFPSQLIGNRDMMNAIDGNMNVYNAPIGFGLPRLSGTTTTTTETLLPMYGSAITDSLPVKTPLKAVSGLTHAFPVSRKRPRDSIDPLMSFANGNILNHTNNCSGSFTFLGEDISLHIQQEQLETDRFIAQHTEKVRLQMDERRKHYSRRMIAAVEEGLAKKLRAKEEEIDKICKLNWALEERVKSLCVENQIWRELAQTNEATASALRSNLEQVLAHVKHSGGALDDTAAAAALEDKDAESCCGSNYDDEERRTLVGWGGEREVVKDKRWWWCRECGKEESCVLLLPCRHLCLCPVCGSSVQACPICTTPKNASLRVIMPS